MRTRERPVRILTANGARLYVHMAYAEVLKRYHVALRRGQTTMQLDGRSLPLERIDRIEPPAEDEA
jgi:hypothetical protein